MDPFCGCATACVAAERVGRKWIGIDISKTAYKLVCNRMEKDLGMFGMDIIHRMDVPRRTDVEKLPNYRTHKQQLYGEQQGICAGCQEHTRFKLMHVDHKLAKSKGGTDHIDNLQLLCGHCNSKKGNKSQAEFISILKREGFIQ